MISVGGENIINICINNNIIYKGILENNVIYQKDVTIYCRELVNIGDWTSFNITIFGKQYIPNIINTNNNMIVNHNSIYFTTCGKHSIIFNYKGYNITIICDVINCELSLT